MALTLSVGFVVDDAIVMLENIVRHMEMGKTRLQAALDGSKEIAFTIVSMTLSLAAVFIPVLFMGGIVGRLMHEFAVTIAAAILVSGLVSLTLTPMLVQPVPEGAALHAPRPVLQRDRARCSTPGWRATRGRCGRRFGSRARRWSSRRCCWPATVYLFTIIPTGFIPSVDTGQLSGQIETIQGLGFDADGRAASETSWHVLARRPERGRVHGERRRTRRRRQGGINVDLKPREERTLTADQVIEELRPKLAAHSRASGSS